MTPSDAKTGPLAGVTVIDLTSVISGPMAMGIFVDQGAEVIKVEPFTGDIMRSRGDVPGFTPGFVASNRGKRSIALDLKRSEAKDVLWRLIERADVLAQNFRPGVIDRLGFGATAALERNPRLVYLSINGVGEQGPYVKKRVYDPVIQALSGLADIQADPRSGRPRMVRTVVADKTTALYAAQAVTSALFHRERTGAGQHVRVSMLDAMVSYIWPEGMADYSIVDTPPAARSRTVHDMIFPTSDGYVTIGAISDAEWKGLCAAINRPELTTDPRFATASARNRNRQERLELVEASLGQITTRSLLEVLEEADVPCAPVLSRTEMISDPQVAANGIVVEIEQPGLGRVRLARGAARFEETPCGPVRPAPSLGEDTDSILYELGFDQSSISDFRESGIVT